MSRRWLVPEVVQSSAMDCGPASLVALLGGFGVHVSYGRLREACQTGVDGTSIDVLEQLAVSLGLDAEQVMVPPEHVLASEAGALPAIAVVRLPNGVTHFVVLWSRLGPWVQVMDPASGRSLVPAAQVARDLLVHELVAPAEAWRAYAGTAEFQAPLRARLVALTADAGAADALLADANRDAGWRALASLDAVARLVAALGSPTGDRLPLIRALLARVAAEDGGDDVVPRAMWSVRPGDDAGSVVARGAILVRVRGRRVEDAERADEPTVALPDAVRSTPPIRPMRALAALMGGGDGGGRAALAIAASIAASAAVTVIEAAALRAMIDAARLLTAPWQRTGAWVALIALVALALVVDLGAREALVAVGRRMETALRLAFVRKLPRLGDRYFASRLTSDMTQRAHALHAVREVPELAGTLARAVSSVALTALGLAVIDPWLAPLACASAALAVGAPLAAWPATSERDLRVRTHLGALSQFTWDALRGAVAIRTHGAQTAVAREHEALAVAWWVATRRLATAGLVAEGVSAVAGYALAVGMLVVHLRGPDAATHAGTALLVVYWAVSLPTLGQGVARVLRDLPAARSVAVRALEPLGAPEDEEDLVDEHAVAADPVGVSVVWDDVSVVAGGHTLLRGVNVRLAPGEHVAVVGASGSGKTTLVGTLLGLHRPAAGAIHVDGAPLDGPAIARLRRSTAWVDPAVALWNRSLLDNLRYGTDDAVEPAPIGRALAAADVIAVLEGLPDGLQTPLGDGGGLISGGEGQRVRLGRAMLRDGVRLVLLDEAFRGLDRDRRDALLANARETWATATLVCVTHDIGAALGFARVLVVDGGQVVEDGDPARLADAGGRFAAMLRRDRALHAEQWGEGWRNVEVRTGRVTERPA